MENRNEESTSTEPNQRLGSLSYYELQPSSSYQQAQKRNRLESPPQSPKGSTNAVLSPPIFPQEIIVEILSNLPVQSLLRFRVYSLRINYWRRIQDFPFGVPCDEAGKYVDGSLNWAVFRRQETGFSWIIVSLDLAHETYKEVLQPVYGNAASERTLGVLDGCLCVLCNYGRMYADVWVMKEHGKRESWTKLVTVSYMPDSGSELFSIPLFVSENGEILLHLGIKLVLYNLKEKTFRIPLVHDNAIAYIDQAEIYVESLVSPTVVNQH
ncbi:hypothetical protein PTKIN_Ptkin17bG0063100 [Pterospermum kingtungense]